ncbi:ROK family protein [Paenibacillus sp. 1001270B_150601_E10]|uniref:ROK family protein n=1 Tax=Paenibacillus sp. 1001270B_150601_E10 TaxID=2787079 RepID=UPI00189EDA48|nr:ROK family protein [Paenibacillus sp. 1001270B_150601_E10]
MSHYVGIDIGGTKMYMFAEIDGSMKEHMVPTGKDCSLAYLKQEIDRFIEHLDAVPAGVGIGLVGLVKGNDRVQFSDMSVLNGVTTEYFSEGRYPVVFLNDVKAATLAESIHYPDHHTVAVLMAGTGLAVGVVSEGKLLQGVSGWSGELGYTLVSVNGEAKKIDQLASGMAILQQAGVHVEEFLEQLEKDDESARSIVEQAGYYCGLAITNLIHLYNPDVLVIGGSTATYKGYLDKALAVVKQYTLPDLYAACSIVNAKGQRRTVALGARVFARLQFA